MCIYEFNKGAVLSMVLMIHTSAVTLPVTTFKKTYTKNYIKSTVEVEPFCFRAVVLLLWCEIYQP